VEVDGVSMLYNSAFLLNVKLGNFKSICVLITKMFYHPPVSLENYTCDVSKNV